MCCWGGEVCDLNTSVPTPKETQISNPPPKLVVCTCFSFSKLVFLGSMFVFGGVYNIVFRGRVNHGKEVTGILGLSWSDEQRQRNLYDHSILLIRS